MKGILFPGSLERRQDERGDLIRHHGEGSFNIR